jgi:hypothetical protein
MARPRTKSSDAPPAPPTDIESELSTSPEGSLSEAFRRDLEKARRLLDTLLRRLHRWHRAAPPRAPTDSVPSAELVARFQMGLKKEHDLVLAPLLVRLEDFGTRLTNNEAVPAETIEEGLALVDRYLNELHDVHLRLLEMADVDPAKGAAALLPLQLLSSDYDHARVRWATVRVMLRGYEEKIRGYGALLGLTLTQESRAERAWHDFEEQYVRAHVPPTFPRKVADAWLAELDKVRDAGRADKVRVENYLVRTDQFGTVRP